MTASVASDPFRELLTAGDRLAPASALGDLELAPEGEEDPEDSDEESDVPRLRASESDMLAGATPSAYYLLAAPGRIRSPVVASEQL